MLATTQVEEVGHNKAWELSTWEKQYVTTARCWRSYHDRVATIPFDMESKYAVCM